MQSPALLMTISYYSIPSGMLGRGLNKYQRLAPDCFQRPLLRRSRFQQQVKPGVSWRLCNFQSRRGASWLSSSMY
jgi:hypothetical protein